MHNHMKIVNRNSTIEHNLPENAARFVHFWANFHALKHYHIKKKTNENNCKAFNCDSYACTYVHFADVKHLQPFVNPHFS